MIRRLSSLLAILALLHLMTWCVVPAYATTSVIQHPNNNGSGCSTTSCAVTTTACNTGGTHAGIFLWYSGTTGGTLTSVTGCGGTWVVPNQSVSGSGCAPSETGAGSAGVAYNLGLTTASTTVTGTHSTTSTTDVAAFLEITSTLGTLLYDICGLRNAASGTNIAGVTLALTGSSDFIAQGGSFAGTASGCGTGYTAVTDFPTGDAVCGANSSTSTPNTYTSTAGAGALVAIALKEQSSAVVTRGKAVIF